MAFRYEHEGQERVAQDIPELERLLRSGGIRATTPVYDETVGARLQAGALVAMNARRASAAPASAQAAARPTASSAPVAPTAAPEGNSKRTVAHRVGATLVAIVAFLVVAELAGIPPTVISDFTTPALVVLFVIVALSGRILGRKSDAQKVRQAWIGAMAWILIWAGLGTWIASIRAERVAADRVAAKAIAESTRRHTAQLEAIVNDQPEPRTSAPAPAPMLASGKGTLIERISPVAAATQTATLRAVREFKAFQDSLDLDKSFEAKNLTSPEGRKRNRETIDRYLTGYEAHHKRLVALLENHRKQLLDVVANDAGKAEFAKGVDTSMSRALADYAEMLKIQRAVAAQMHAVNDFVTARGGTIQLQDGQIAFATQADVDAYGRLFAALDELAKQEEAVQKRQLARARQAADMIEALPGK